jgi:C1A family cysteine protease
VGVRHAILCRGFNAKKKTFLVHNSWGPKWGKNGTALIHWDDMQTLLAKTGDACIPMKRNRV